MQICFSLWPEDAYHMKVKSVVNSSAGIETLFLFVVGTTVWSQCISLFPFWGKHIPSDIFLESLCDALYSRMAKHALWSVFENTENNKS